MARSFFRSVLALVLVCSMALLAGCALPGFLQQGKKEPPKPREPKATTVALVVPAGQMASVVNSLTGGARLAAQEQPASSPVKVQVVRMQGNWLQTLAALPDNAVIGGPVTEAAYRQMKQAGIMDKKVVFAFMAQIDAGDEGTKAWRFFPSMDDQIDAIVELAVDRLDLRTMASFGPSDNYANKATSLLEQKLASKNVILQRIQATGSPDTWGALVKPYVNPTTDEATGALIPQTPFEAVFLPDSWRRLSSVHTAFASNGEDRLVMFGTMLWGGFNNRGTQNASQYALVTYPAAYVSSRAPASLAKSSYSTFWGALGYDFVRFASRMNIKGRPGSSEVSAMARQAALMNFVLAPISYDSRGRAKQNLFMVQPGVAGSTLVDATVLGNARKAAVLRAEERRAHAAELETTPLGSGEGAGTIQQPVQTRPTGPIMRTTPHSSHKLSLPGAR